jgi:hypothetical protein
VAHFAQLLRVRHQYRMKITATMIMSHATGMAAANKATKTAATIVYAAPAASAPNDVAGAGVASIEPR